MRMFQLVDNFIEPFYVHWKDIRQESNAICYNGNTEGLNVDHDTKKKVQSFTRERISKINADDRKDVKLLTKDFVRLGSRETPALSMTRLGKSMRAEYITADQCTTASEKHKVEMVHSSNESEHSEKHMWRFYEKLRLKTTNTSITFVLLITYGRSGSSWLGDMISQAGSTIYVFEPLQRTAPQGFFKDNLVCFNNNTCRRPRKLIERHTTILATLYKLFTCQMSRLLPFFKGIMKNNLRSKNHKLALNQCRSKNTTTFNSCLKKMEPMCASTTHRVIKTIRISMELVDILMKLWPNLKIVHLIRDPRAVTHSRIRSSEFSMARDVFTHSQDLCSRMYEDVIQHMKLQKLYHNRLKLVIYEALTERPMNGARDIYKFLNMTMTKQVVQWIYQTTHANKKANSEYFGTSRNNVTELVSSWRIKMDLLKVQVIDYFCKDLYTLVGFIPMNSTEQLRSLRVPSRRKSSIDGFV